MKQYVRYDIVQLYSWHFYWKSNLFWNETETLTGVGQEM